MTLPVLPESSGASPARSPHASPAPLAPTRAGLERRDVVRMLIAAPLALAFPWAPEDVERAARSARGALDAAVGGETFQPGFFTPHEWETVRVLVDDILPRDERSGSATDAGVPEFMDFIMTDPQLDGRSEAQTWMRGGLAWLDDECQERFGMTFVECADRERAALLDDISWPDRAPSELSHGVEFFGRCRDLTAAGFFSSKIGVEDLRYMGNAPVEWNGCPDEQLRKLDVRYEDG